MEKSIVWYLVLILIGYVKDSDGAEESEDLIQSSWNMDTLSPGTERNLNLIVVTEFRNDV